MKTISFFISILVITSCASGQERTFTASTPAAATVRSFLNIPLSDSVDFIRWKVLIKNDHYDLQCKYGIGKPNTNDFVNGGRTIQLSGECRKEKNLYGFQNGIKRLKAVELNTDLLHLLDPDNNLLVGNGGWSYTLNNIYPLSIEQISIHAAPMVLNDSMIFDGRTPCNVPGIVAPGTTCYKLKWRIILYANSKQNTPSRYKILSTAWRKQGGKNGNWKIITKQNGQIVYQLNDEKGNGFLYLVKLDEHILMFTDVEGNLLVGDHDFSYTLNAVQ